MRLATLGYALLGLLARKPRSGYDLAQLMRNPIGYFWHAQHSQIYPELARLEAAGMVTHEVVEQYDRPDKKIYAIAEAGRAALREWVTEPAHVRPDRDELMLKTFSIWLADRERAIAFYRASEEYHASRLAVYESYLREFEREDDIRARRVDSPRFMQYATLRRGIDYERSYAEWCRWMVETLGQAPDAQEAAE
jgi:PadR family transcriptional regulator AphA